MKRRGLLMQVNRFYQVIGNTNTKIIMQNILRVDKSSSFIILRGAPGHGKSTLARVGAQYILCENPTEFKEPCGKCPSCFAFEQGALPNNCISINVGKFKNMKFLEQFESTLQSLFMEKNVVILEELQGLEKDVQEALMDILDKKQSNIRIIATTYKEYTITKTIRDRAFSLRVGLDNNGLKAFTDTICKSYPIPLQSRQYLLSKHLSPRELENVITNQYIAGRTEVYDFQEYFNESSETTSLNFINAFTSPMKQLAATVQMYNNEDLVSLISSARYYLTNAILKIEYNSGNKSNKDYSAKLVDYLSQFDGKELLLLLHCFNKMAKLKEPNYEIYSIKYYFEVNKKENNLIKTLEYQNREMYGLIPPNPADTTKKVSEEVQTQIDAITTKQAIASFGTKSFTLDVKPTAQGGGN